MWQREEHVPVTEEHVPLHLDGSGAREPRADTSLPDHSKHPNNANLDLARRRALPAPLEREQRPE